MNCTLQYPKKTPYEVREEMDRIEQSESKPLSSCQINGIDWEKRIDNRKKRRERDMKKKADAYNDYMQSLIISHGLNTLSRGRDSDGYSNGNLGNTVSSIGSLTGLFEGKTPSLEDLAKMENDNAGWIPGNADRRLMLRRRMVNKELKGNPNTVYSEHFGGGTSGLLTMLGGAGLGAVLAGGVANRVGSPSVIPAVMAGGIGGLLLGGIGAGIANGVGGLRAAFTPTRTNKEQQEYEQAPSHWGNWLIPGVATYNKFKSLGVSNRMLREYMDKKEQEKKKAEEKDAVMEKESAQFRLAKAASYVMCKRSSSSEVLQALQKQVADNYIASLKKERDRSMKDDLFRGAISGGLNGAQYGLLSGLLFGTTVAPAKDLVRGSDRTVVQSLGRGAGLGGASGMGAGALIGAGVGALNNWATRDRRKQQAIAKLKELGIED